MMREKQLQDATASQPKAGGATRNSDSDSSSTAVDRSGVPAPPRNGNKRKFTVDDSSHSPTVPAKLSTIPALTKVRKVDSKGPLPPKDSAFDSSEDSSDVDMFRGMRRKSSTCTKNFQATGRVPSTQRHSRRSPDGAETRAVEPRWESVPSGASFLFTKRNSKSQATAPSRDSASSEASHSQRRPKHIGPMTACANASRTSAAMAMDAEETSSPPVIQMASQGPTKRHVAPNALPHNDLATTESHPPPRSGKGVDLWDSNSNSDDSLPRSSGLGSGGRDSRPEPALLRMEASPRTSVQPKRRRCSPKTSSASTSSSSLGRPSLTGPDHLFDGCSSSDDDQVVASQRRRRRHPIHRKTAPSLASQTKSPPPLKHRSVFDPNRRESYRSLDNTDDDDDLDENAEPRRNQFLCPPPPRGDRLEKGRGRGGTGDHQSLSSSICTSSQEASLASSSPTERRWRVAPHAGSAARSSGAAPVAHPGPSSSTSSRGRMQLSLRKVPRSRGELWDS